MAHGRDAIHGDTCFSSMLSNAVFVGSQVDAVDFILRDVTVQPLNLRSHGLHGA